MCWLVSRKLPSSDLFSRNLHLQQASIVNWSEDKKFNEGEKPSNKKEIFLQKIKGKDRGNYGTNMLIEFNAFLNDKWSKHYWSPPYFEWQTQFCSDWRFLHEDCIHELSNFTSILRRNHLISRRKTGKSKTLSWYLAFDRQHRRTGKQVRFIS